jgi:hypothetical protein
MKRYHVSVAAEAYAAAAFARAGYEVSVQYGANQPGYDLVVVKGERTLKVSVKGSQDGGWIINAPFKKPGVNWPQALAAWLASQPKGVIMFYVQFQDARYLSLPNMYLATAQEVHDHMLTTRAGHIAGCLYEKYSFVKGLGKGSTDAIPQAWALSEHRIENV